MIEGTWELKSEIHLQGCTVRGLIFCVRIKVEILNLLQKKRMRVQYGMTLRASGQMC